MEKRPVPITFPLFDFPEEMLLVMAEHMTVKELWIFATLCRRLHYTLLPIYFQRCGLPKWESFSSQGLSLAGDGLGALPGLQIAHFVTKVPRITCRFGSTEADFLESVGRLRALVARITHLKEVTLEFTQIAEEEGIELNPLSWVRPVERLLTTISTWTCAKLKVVGGLTCPLGLHQVGSGIRIGHRLSQSISWIGRKGIQPLLTGHLSDEDLEYSVTELHIASPMFCYRLFRKWTVSALETRNITKLSLCDMPLERPNQWDTFLSASMTQLRDLTIIACSVEFRSIENFLHRHPDIMSLCLDKLSYPPGSLQPFRPWFRCPHLRTLKAPVEYLVLFLAETRVDITPLLDEVIILGSGPDLSADFALIPWYSLDVSSILLNETYAITLSMDIALSYVDDFGWGPSEVATKYLRHITTLVVRPGGYGAYLERENWPRFREWLECFPSLVHLVILDGEVERMRIMKDPATRKDFIRQMMSVFARVSRVNVAGEEIWIHSDLDPPLKVQIKVKDKCFWN
ncbi:hypothetical protein BDZ94DRAFT_1256117 [Collybia nuda]|uniref:F-box domain-containing protein n=1 Tax=Collybia nuda TaxID=64659 RepID=A0A9P5YB22_9AGAR|nr:hypothetical protein BDZ94DRAFT_1256117 [Collybia nuda]